jgi:TM2 domain-containing membrane protein YozV
VSEPGQARCPTCGALVTADAEWCGQCFTPLPKAPQPVAVASSAAGGGDLPVVEAGPKKALTWPCPTCGNDNAIELDACSVCGTSFAALLRGEDRPKDVDPGAAFTRSLLFPGLGHAMVGRGIDGLARGALFWWMFLTTLLLLISGVSSGPMVVLLALFGTATIVIYLFTAFEASRMARGGDPFVSSRLLLWCAVGMVIVSVLVAGILIASTSSG